MELMLCPKCLGEIQIVKNAVFCPNCKIYLSESVDSFIALYNQKVLQEQKASFGKVSEKIQKKLTLENYKTKSFKFIKVFLIIFIFSALIYNYFLYFDFKNGCFVKIIPSITLEFSNSNIKRSIKILKLGSPSDYQDFCRFVDTIDANIDCGGFEGGCYRGGKRIAVSTAQGTVSWTVAIIVHETCHAIQIYEKRGIDESECYAAGDRILGTIVEI